MSKNFERVKRNIIEEMKSIRSHDGESWARIMLTNSSRLTSEEDQKDFFRWILDPTDERDDKLEFCTYKPVETIPTAFSVQVDEGDEKSKTVECTNHVVKNGYTMFIDTRVCNSEEITLHTPSADGTDTECKNDDIEPVGPIEC